MERKTDTEREREGERYRDRQREREREESMCGMMNGNNGHRMSCRWPIRWLCTSGQGERESWRECPVLAYVQHK